MKTKIIQRRMAHDDSWKPLYISIKVRVPISGSACSRTEEVHSRSVSMYIYL